MSNKIMPSTVSSTMPPNSMPRTAMSGNAVPRSAKPRAIDNTPSAFFTNLMLWLLAVALFFAPWPLGSNRIWAFSLLHMLIAGAALVHFVACAWHKWPLWHSRWQVLVLFGPLLLAAVLGLQLFGLAGFNTVDTFQTSMLLQRTLYLALFVYLLSQYGNSYTAVAFMLKVIIISGTLQATYGSGLYLAGIEGSWFFNLPLLERARGSFVYQNHFANYLALCIAMAIGWMLSELSRQDQQLTLRQWLRSLLDTMLSNKMLLRLAVIIMILGLIMSRSRMGNTGFFMSLAVVSILALFLFRNPPRWLKPVVISIFVLDLLLVGSMFGVEKVKERLQETSFANEARDEVVMHSLPLLQDNWLTGTGGSTFYTVFPAYQQAAFSGFYDHAHNDYLQFAIEFGVPVTVLVGLWVLIALVLALATMRKRKTRLYQGLGFGAAMAIMHMLIHCTVDFNLQAPANALLFVTIITLAIIGYYAPAQRRHN